VSDGGGEKTVHVLHVVPGLPPGGMELALARVVAGLPGMRHTVVCLKGEAVIRDRFDALVPIHCLHARPNELGLPWRLARLIRELRPTVIHARNWSAWPDVAIARRMVRPRVPLVLSFHGQDAARAMPWRRRVVTRWVAASATRFFTVSQEARRFLVDGVGVAAERVEIIPNGVDLERFRPEPHARGGRFVVGTAGSLSSVKNHALLVRAYAALAGGGMDVGLRIAGEGPERPRLEALIRSLGLEGRVELAGHQEDVPAFLNGLDLFVLSSDSEAHPNALLEAMACGVPCVGTRVGGVPEVLGYGQFGRLVDAGDEGGLIEAMREVAEDRGAAEALGRAARERAVARYGMPQMLRAYEALYRDPESRPAAAEDEVDVRPRVLMMGPLPPLPGGMATVVENLRHSTLADRCRLACVNNGKTTPEGRPLWAGVAAQWRLLGRLWAGMRREGAEIVHIHTIQYFGFWRDAVHAVLARRLGRPVILHMHGASFDRWAAEMGRVRRAVLRHVLEAASAVIVLSERWRETLRPYGPRARWCVVPNGVRLPRRLPSRGAAEPVFLFLGDWTARKGVLDLVAVVERAAAGGFRGRVHLAGFEKEPGQREALDRRIAESGCGARIRVLGTLGAEAKEAALAAADVLVLPSYAEGLPMAVLEAMAWGMPVIATRVGAIPEAVADGVEGYLIEPGDLGALADRMSRLASDAAMRARMGAAARERAEREFSLEAGVERLMQLYEDLLGRRAAR